MAVKRTLSVAACMAAFICSAVFAGGEGEEAEGPVRISFATSVYVEPPHQAVIDELIRTYGEKNPNVVIEVYGAGWSNFWDNMTTEILSNNEADIVQMYPPNIAQYHALRPEGTFWSMDERVRGTALETDLVGQEFSAYEGEYLALSNYAWGTTALFYRKSMLEAAGVDPGAIKSMEDFRQASLKLTEGDRTGFGVVVSSHSFVVSEWARFLARAASGGLYFPNEAGPYTAARINVDDPANVWAAEWWQQMLLSDRSALAMKNKKPIRELFWNGKMAFNLDGPWFIGMTEVRDPSLFDDIGLIPQPYVEYGGTLHRPNPTMYPLVAAISNNSKHKEEAWDFLEWMASPEAQEIIAKCGMIPNSRSYVRDSDYESGYPFAYRFFDFIENDYDPLVADPSIPQIGELQQVMIEATQLIFSSLDESPEAVLQDAAEKMKAIMNR